MDPHLPSELERRLLEAARQDRIPEALGARMAHGLGVQLAGGALLTASAGAGASASASASAGPGTAKLSTALSAKSVLCGALVVAGTIGVAGFQLAQRAPMPSPHATTSAVAAAPSALASAPTESAPIGSAPTEPASQPTVTPAPIAPARTERAAVLLPARPVARSDDAALRAEVMLLDRARDALRAGASARALSLLDQHHRRFAQPTLEPEASALRIEALVLRGSRAEADALSQQFATRYPSHPLRARVEALRRPE